MSISIASRDVGRCLLDVWRSKSTMLRLRLLLGLTDVAASQRLNWRSVTKPFSNNHGLAQVGRRRGGERRHQTSCS